MKSQWSGLAVGLVLSASPVLAHHSAAQFDFQKPTQVEGVVQEMLVANPHTKLVLDVTDDKGTRLIEFEGHSRNNVYRRGWRPDIVKTGDKVTISIAPRKDGGDGGYVLSVKTADGREF
jgi:hypothetical protein